MKKFSGKNNYEEEEIREGIELPSEEEGEANYEVSIVNN
jgi:hypothetical protein